MTSRRSVLLAALLVPLSFALRLPATVPRWRSALHLTPADRVRAAEVGGMARLAWPALGRRDDLAIYYTWHYLPQDPAPLSVLADEVRNQQVNDEHFGGPPLTGGALTDKEVEAALRFWHGLGVAEVVYGLA